MLYFPNIDEDELPDHSFMWGILGTLKKDEWKKLIEEARVSRSLDSAESKEDPIEIHPDFLDALLATPNLPGRKYDTHSGLYLNFRKRASCYFAKKLQNGKVSEKKREAASGKSSNNLISKGEPPWGRRGEGSRRPWESSRARYENWCKEELLIHLSRR